MKLAIMQPYFFPYIGYFQLINSVDKFIFYDDVDYIKQGWINRNKILLNGEAYLFTVPVRNASSSVQIKDTSLHEQSFRNWKKNFYSTLDMAYHKAPFYQEVIMVLQNVLDKGVASIAELAADSIRNTLTYLDIQVKTMFSSEVYTNFHSTGKERVIDICLQEKATTYINASGGSELYKKEDFQSHGLNLQFIKPDSIVYTQFENEFAPDLSIIDIMMFKPGK